MLGRESALFVYKREERLIVVHNMKFASYFIIFLIVWYFSIVCLERGLGA